MAVQTVMLVATYFGEQEINWGDPDKKTLGLISSILIIQLVVKQIWEHLYINFY